MMRGERGSRLVGRISVLNVCMGGVLLVCMGFGADRAASEGQGAPFEGASTEGLPKEGESAAKSLEDAAGLRLFNLRLPAAPGGASDAANNALRDFKGPNWLRGALNAWREEHPEALDAQLPTPFTGTNDGCLQKTS